MRKNKKLNIWGLVARLILRNRFLILLGILLLTGYWSTQWKNMQFTFTEANLLPDNHPENILYQSFIQTFGEEGNVIVIAVQDSSFYNSSQRLAWKALNEKIEGYQEINFVLSTENIQELVKDNKNKSFVLKEVSKELPPEGKFPEKFKEKLYLELPFFENLLFEKNSNTIRSIIYMDPEIVNTAQRKDFIFDVFIPLIKDYEETYDSDIRVSGMPYIRTLNAQNIVDEIGLFVLGAALITTLIFFLFFRSFRATFISLIVVAIGVMWAFGILGWLGYEITVLTALIPPLIIVIGVPNCIFLINKYQQEIAKHRNQAKSLQRVIAKIGNATLMTNLTTASGFATFILTNSKILKEFGVVASINIIAIFLLSLLIIPITYSFMERPNKKHLRHLKNKTVDFFVTWMEKTVRKKRVNVYLISLLGLIIGITGIYQIKISGSLIEDMPKSAPFFKDILFFDATFNGIVPLEIWIDSKREEGIVRPATLRRMNQLQETIDEIPELAPSLSVVNAVKYAKQAYYNGNPNYFALPTSQENSFIYPFLNSSNSNSELLNGYVDSTGQFGRITTYMKDIKTSRMEEIEADLKESIAKIFPKDRYGVNITGKSLLFLKGTKYLINNLILSLSLAILLIALFMAFLFRSFKMILISLIPNLLPLIITAGVMGFTGIPLKPSTILVFSIAFGISVDDTIHFLAKYRQELIANGWKINKAVFAALRETGISMFYTSVVLFFGFSIFMSSNFGGTQALGGLVAVTLMMAMLANLVLLPSLLISLEDSISNDKVLKEPKLEILD
ncbi:MAG: efflux RND transporter permease subunit [Flavobacteriaceae bacterium]|nr:efflux RND transporter permease subunit [Flavobacteriaceae bacterium]MDG1919945.1 efflux RND transporter permease subunit [Flavobacteriaceae bacterium]